MIHIRIDAAGERIRSVEVSGHGGAARGKDVVCAAISAVAETALAGLLHYGGDRVSWRMDEGFVSMRIRDPGDDDASEPLNVVMTTLVIGIKEIAREYPQQVRLELKQDPGIPDEA
jgi:uncharacterized protein YsxB (DUF464 family)